MEKKECNHLPTMLFSCVDVVMVALCCLLCDHFSFPPGTAAGCWGERGEATERGEGVVGEKKPFPSIPGRRPTLQRDL